MTPQQRLELQALMDACDLAIEALRVFRSWLQAWQSHPQTGQLPPDLVDAIIDDLRNCGLEGWVYSQAVWQLRRIVCEQNETGNGR